MQPAVGGHGYLRGVAFAVAGAFFAAAYFIPYKAAVALVAPEVFVLLLYAIGFGLTFAGGLLRRTRIRLDRPTLVGGVVLAALSVLAHVSIGKSLQGLDPALATVMVRTQILFVLLMESALLRIPAAPLVRPCALVVLAGIALLNVTEELTLSAGIGFYLWGALAAFCFGAMQIYIKRFNRGSHPITLNYCRLFFGALAIALVPGAVAGVPQVPLEGWGLIAAAALVGPVLSRIFQIYALQTLTPSQVVLVDMLAPAFAALLAWLLLGLLPTPLQGLGGAVIMLGIVLPVAWPWVRARLYTSRPSERDSSK